MMGATVDIKEESSFSHDILAGWEIVLAASVSGLQDIATVTRTGTTTANSQTVTMADTSGVLVGMAVAGTGIPVDVTNVVSIVTNTSITISHAATASGTVSLAFGSLDSIGLTNAAIGSVIAVLGDRGSQCPNVGVPTYLKSFSCKLESINSARVLINYKGYPLPTFEFEGSLNSIPSILDLDGNPITVSYTYPTTYPDPTLAGQTKVQGAEITRPVPERIVSVRWLVTDGTLSGVPATATEIMAWFKITFEGYINDDTYNIAFINGAKHTWRIDKVSGVSDDGGQTYKAMMVFHQRLNTWDELRWFVDPATGKPPADLVNGVGYKLIQGSPETGFPTFTFPPN